MIPMETIEKTKMLKNLFDVTQKAIETGQIVKFNRVFYAIDQSLIFKVEIIKNNEAFNELEGGLLNQEQAQKVIDFANQKRKHSP
jgi:hypothetical protein